MHSINTSLIVKLCVVFTLTLVCLQLSSSSYLSITNNLPSLRLPKSPYGTCVVHLIIIDYDSLSRDTAQQFLLDNYNSSIWTVSVFERRFRQIPNRIVGFQEECTITVFSDRENPFSRKGDWDLLKNFFIVNSLYSFLSRGKFSIFLILRFYCGHPDTGDLARYPVSVFIHYLKCDAGKFTTKRFPGFVLDQRRNAYKKRKRNYAIYSPKEIARKEIEVNFLTPDIIDQYMDCTTFQTVSLKISQITCSQVLYLAQHLTR